MDQFIRKRLKTYLLCLIVFVKINLICSSESEIYYASVESNSFSGETTDVTEIVDDRLFFDTTTVISESYAVEEVTTTLSPIDLKLPKLPPLTIRQPVINHCRCGVPRMYHGITRVIGGYPVRDGEFPWFAAVTRFQHNKKPRWRVVCGATLLNGAFAITAAHCLHKRFKDTLEVVFNVKDVHNITTDPGVTRLKIKQFLIHPDYDPQTQHNDIALIEFKVPIDLNMKRDIVPICLPTRVNDKRRNGTFVGFGHTSYGSASPGPKENSRTLLKIDVPILSHSECLQSKVPTKKNITEFMVCAGREGKDACINDSGGPLMTQENGKSILEGLASWGIGCALPQYPGVYTKVAKYVEWIKRTATYDTLTCW